MPAFTLPLHEDKIMNEPRIHMELNADEIREHDAIDADKRAIEAVMKVAQQHAQNQLSVVFEKETKMWNQRARAMGYESINDVTRLRLVNVHNRVTIEADPLVGEVEE